LVLCVEALGDEENAGHNRHAAGPISFLKVPARHAAHVPPFGPVKPALQAQAEAEELLEGEFEFGRHALHTPAVVYGITDDCSSE